jgi:lipid II:glycine glycyltransferase (peptidoglycan interpeptide bridge formation enzyme)
MAKTKPIGVRFNEELLSETGLTPQKALNTYEESHMTILKKKANDKLGNAVFPKIQDLTKSTNEIKPLENPATNYSINTTNSREEEILKNISEIRKQEIPKERNTPLGKKAWELEQEEKIKSLQKQLF